MSTDRLSESDQTRMDYWGELTRYMKRRNSLIMFNEPNSNRPHQLRAKADTFGSGKIVLVALANVSRVSRIGVGIEISGPKEYYAALAKDESEIQREISDILGDKRRLEWEPGTKVSDIWLYWEADCRGRQQWTEQHKWLSDRLEVFQRVIKPRLAELSVHHLKSKRAI